MAIAYSMLPPVRRPRQSFWLRGAPLSAILLWLGLWSNLNTGPWFISIPETLGDWPNLIRSILPFFILPISGFLLLQRGKLHLPSDGPSRLLLMYGLVGLLAAVLSPDLAGSLYYSMTFLATIFAAWTFIKRADSTDSARQLLIITWVATFIVAAIIGYQARGSVFGQGSSAYYALSDELHGASKSEGVARWAAVPGLVCLVRAYYTRRFSLMAFYIGVAVVSFYIVYRMQSRGAVFGAVAALIFALLVSSRMRKYALPFAAIALVVILLLDSPANVSKNVTTYLKRGQTTAQFLSMTGRTTIYARALDAFQSSPIIGRGQLADRNMLGEHVHNSFLMALLNTGIVGSIPYCLSWVAGWMLFFKIQKKIDRLSPDDRVHVLECGAVMMFFSVRAIPETTTASFVVDLLVMVAIYVYLESFSMSLKRRPVRQLVPVFVRMPERGPVAVSNRAR